MLKGCSHHRQSTSCCNAAACIAAALTQRQNAGGQAVIRRCSCKNTWSWSAGLHSIPAAGGASCCRAPCRPPCRASTVWAVCRTRSIAVCKTLRGLYPSMPPKEDSLEMPPVSQSRAQLLGIMTAPAVLSHPAPVSDHATGRFRLKMPKQTGKTDRKFWFSDHFGLGYRPWTPGLESPPRCHTFFVRIHTFFVLIHTFFLVNVWIHTLRYKIGGGHTFDVWVHTKKYEFTHWKVWIHTFLGKCMTVILSMCEFILFGGKVWQSYFLGKKYEFTHQKYEPPFKKVWIHS